MVSANYFAFVGARLQVGRGFRPEDDQSGANFVAVVSHRLWQECFEASPEVLGKSLNLDGHVFEVVGVAPPGFVGMGSRPPDFWVTYAAKEFFFRSPPLTVYGRLQAGVSPAAAAASLAPIIQEVTATLHPTPLTTSQTPEEARNNSAFTRVALFPAGYGTTDRHFAYEFRKTRIPVIGLAGLGTLLVLLIAASNLAHLLLAQGLDRRREIATRLALGATRGTLVRQLALEGIVLAALGALVALLVLHGSARMAPAFMTAVVFNPDTPMNLHPDIRVIAFAVGLTLLVGVGFSVPPALLATGFAPFPALKDPGSGGWKQRWSVRRTLVVAQVAGSLVLLCGVVLCLRAIQRELDQDLGFRPESLVVAPIDLEQAGYEPDTAGVGGEETRRRLSALPGVEAVGLIDGPPLAGERGGVVTDRLEGHKGTDVTFGLFEVGPQCFHALGIPVLDGREATPADVAAGRRVALVNESFARRYWPGQRVLGKEIEYLKEKHEIIGLVRDARLETLRHAPQPTAFLSPGFTSFALHPTFIVRAKAQPGPVANAVRAELGQIHPPLREQSVRTLREVMDASLSAQRKILNLLREIAAVALGLTLLGAYGLMTYLVKQRTREIGIRLAVGARRLDVFTLVVKSGLRLAMVGTMLGLPAAFGASFLLRHLLTEVSPFDLLSFAIAAGAVALAIVAACWLPARRAARVDPVVALRSE
jgi:predicted permease